MKERVGGKQEGKQKEKGKGVRNGIAREFIKRNEKKRVGWEGEEEGGRSKRESGKGTGETEMKKEMELRMG